MKKKKFKLWKLILILIPVLILGGAAAVLLPLHINYTKTSYERVKPVEAPEEHLRTAAWVSFRATALLQT